MIVHTIANLAIIILDIYLLFKLSKGFLRKEDFSKQQIILYTLLQSIVGILLMFFSNVVMETRIDFRFLLYSISMKYLGWKVTIPTMCIVGVVRFLFGNSLAAWVDFAGILFMMATLPFVCTWAERKFDELGQWMILITYSLITPIASMIYFFSDIQQIVFISFILSASSYLLAFVSYKIIVDLQNVVKIMNTDNLTQLHNPRKFREDLERFENQNKICSVIVLDIDFFKRFNDLFGHAVGNLVLQEVSGILSGLCAKSAQFYRVGGEEFVVLVSDCSLDVTIHLAEKIQEDIHGLSISLDKGERLKVTMSIGIAYRKDKEKLKETVNRADRALYQAKNNGRDQIVVG